MSASHNATGRRRTLKDGFRGIWVGGAERDRTADLLIANEALSQLSYGPNRGRISAPGMGAIYGWHFRAVNNDRLLI